MTRSVKELRRESERSRAELATTVDQLRERISDTAEDIATGFAATHQIGSRRLHQPQDPELGSRALKARGHGNPMRRSRRACGRGSVLRLARGSSLPLLMIGAGLALTSKAVRSRSGAAAPAMDKARKCWMAQRSAPEALGGDVKDGLSRLKARPPACDKAQDTAAGVADDLRGRSGAGHQHSQR
jgi:hypothetical protein